MNQGVKFHHCTENFRFYQIVDLKLAYTAPYKNYSFRVQPQTSMYLVGF